jgi:hypothetical protein
MDKRREIPVRRAGSIGLGDPPVAVLLALLAVLTLVWVAGALRDWSAIAARPERLATLVADVTTVIIPGFVALVLVQLARPRARLWYVLVLGTFLYAVVHNVAYLAWDNYFGVPLAVAVAGAVIFAAYVVYAVRAIRDEG